MKDIPKWFKYIVIVVIVLGVLLRFHNLELRPYWGDEAATSVEIHGSDYDSPEFQNKFFNRVITAKELNKFLYPDTRSNAVKTLSLIAKKEPQLSPLYFILQGFWIKIFGNTIATIRSFSALLGVLVVLSIYWLSMQLFHSRTTALIAMAIVATSPFQLVYSQEARPYMLWSLIIVLSNIALLRAVNKPGPINWIIYCFSIILSLYTHIFSLLVYAGHVLFLLIYEKFRITRKLISLIISAIAALFCFSPWMFNFILNTDKSPSWSFDKFYNIPFYYLLHYFHNLGIVFADFNVGVISPKIVQIFYALLILGIITIVILALRFLYLKGDNLPRSFLISVLIMSFLPLFLKDLFLGGGVTQVIRYFVPDWLAIELIVAYWLSNKIRLAGRPKIIGLGLLLSLLLIGLISDLLMTNSDLWWNKLEGNFYRQYANQVIAKAKNPLLITDDPYFPAAVSLSTLVDPNVRFLLFSGNAEVHIPSGESDVFLFLYIPSEDMIKRVQKNYKLEHVALKGAYPGGGINSKHFFRVITN